MRKYIKISLMLAIVMTLGHLSMTGKSTDTVGTTIKSKTCLQVDHLELCMEIDKMQLIENNFLNRALAVGRSAYQYLTQQVFYANKPKNWKQGANPQQILNLCQEDLSKFDI